MKRKGIAAAGAAAVAALLATVPAGAGEPTPTLSVSPTSGPAGTTVTFSGENCPNGTIRVGILRPDEVIGTRWPIAITQLDVDESGEWFGEIVVPASAPLPDGDGNWIPTEVVPGAGYTAGGFCASGVPNQVAFEFEEIPFEVTEGSIPTTTIPGSTTTTTPPVWEPPTTAPPAATPITDDPPFTG